MKLTLGQIADWIHAEGDFDAGAEALGYSIDSRTLGAGDLFFAVRGERTDGHDYVETALINGAIAAVVSMRWLRPDGVDENRLLRLPECDAADTVLLALQTLAAKVRRRWGKRVIGITGSAGKTTTKECVAAVLATQFSVLKTEGNYNNHFGVPLTLLRLEPEHEMAVVEMGMNHSGEITALAKIAEPDWGVVSNVGPVHLEFFPQGISGIAWAKYELVQALPPEGIAILNGDDQRVAAMARGRGDRAVMYGTHNGVAVRAIHIEDRGLLGTDFEVELRGFEADPLPMTLQLPGRHNVLNALAAVTVGVIAGIEPLECVSALEQMRPGEKRGNVVEYHGARIVNDTYNSNPAALESMIRALAVSNANRRVLIAGEMLELGPDGERLHAECGQAAADAGIDVVIGVRGLARQLVRSAADAGARAMYVETPEAAGEWLRNNAGAGDVILLKASRGVRLERALASLTEPSH